MDYNSHMQNQIHLEMVAHIIVWYYWNTIVTQRELMRVFEGDIKTDILNSTYFSISKEQFDTKTITCNIPIKNYRYINLKLSDHFEKNYQDMVWQSYWFVHKPIADIKKQLD